MAQWIGRVDEVPGILGSSPCGVNFQNGQNRYNLENFQHYKVQIPHWDSNPRQPAWDSNVRRRTNAYTNDAKNNTQTIMPNQILKKITRIKLAAHKSKSKLLEFCPSGKGTHDGI